jgi:hypothetical protein
MKISGRVLLDAGRAIIQTGPKKFVLVPYPRETQLPEAQKISMGAFLFGYLHDREAHLTGDAYDGHLYNARELGTRTKIRDRTILPEKKNKFSVEIGQYFERDGPEIATRLNFAGILTVSAFYHRLKGSEAEIPAMSRYLRVPEESIRSFIKGIESDQKSSALITAPPRIPVAHGVNVSRLFREKGVRATRKSRSLPPPFPESARTPALPSTVDHRKKMTSVRNQGYRGTCVAHATAAMLEYELVRAKKLTRRVDLSEQYLYWGCKQIDGATTDEGTFIEYGVQVLRGGVPRRIPQQDLSPGTCKESDWKYSSVLITGNESHGPLPMRAETATRFAIRSYKKVKENSISDLKNALADGHCVGMSVFTYHFWNDGYVSREGIISLPVGIPPDGAHAICLVGYEDSDSTHGDGYFLFKNSWGPLWGAARPDPGFGSLPYRYVINEAIEAWFIEL